MTDDTEDGIERYVEVTGRAGAAVDVARLCSDEVAVRIVACLAGDGLDRPDLGAERLRRLALTSTEIAEDAARLGARHEEARARAATAFDRFDEAAEAEALADLDALVADGLRIEARARALTALLPAPGGAGPAPTGPAVSSDVVDLDAVRTRRFGRSTRARDLFG